jgi:hypothetical protein
MIALKSYNKDACIKTGLTVFLFFTLNTSFGQYHPVAKESGVRFTIHNFGFKVSGTLSAPEGIYSLTRMTWQNQRFG